MFQEKEAGAVADKLSDARADNITHKSRVKLRDYQQRAVTELCEAAAAGAGRVVLAAPCGAGKTTIFAEVARRMSAEGKTVLFVVHRKELVEQAYDRAVSMCLEPGVVMAGDKRLDYSKSVQICSIQSLARRAFDHAPDVIFFDEGHRSCSKSYTTLIDRYKGATIVSMTATPWRLDGKGLGGIYDRVIETCSYSELIDGGYLVRPDLYIPTSIKDVSFKSVKVSRMTQDYDAKEVSRSDEMKVVLGNVVELYNKHACGMSAVVYTPTIDLAHSVAGLFSEAGISASAVSFNTPKHEREDIIGQFKSGEIKVLTNVELFTEGFDMPSLECVMLMRPTKSFSLYVQMCGRAMRTHNGKTGAKILDLCGNALEFGHPSANLSYDLDPEAAKKSRMSSSVKVCEECGYVMRAHERSCPACGYTKKVENVRSVAVGHGELVAIDDIEPKINKRTKYIGPQNIESCTCCGSTNLLQKRYPPLSLWILCRDCGRKETISASGAGLGIDQRVKEYKKLKKTARTRGYRDGWVGYRYKDLFGTWPTSEIIEAARA